MQKNTSNNLFQNNVSYPSVCPIPEGQERPFWSVMIPTYNPVNYSWLEQTIESVLKQAQEYETMQVELVDDCSTNFDPEDFIKKSGSNRITCFRQKKQVNIAGNWNTCIKRARGYWVHILHQDDIVLPGFYKRLHEGIKSNKNIGAAFCQHFLIDSNGKRMKLLSRVKMEAPGILKDWLEYVFVGLSFQCPSIVVKRSVYEELGGFAPEFKYALDWDMWKRIASRYPIWHDPKPLACFRRNSKSTASGFIKSGENITELIKSIEISKHYLPESVADEITRKTKIYYTRHAARNAADLLFDHRELGAAIVQILKGSKLSSFMQILRALAWIFVHERFNWR